MSSRKKILFIGGSLNQTTMMHQIAQALPEHDCFFSGFYADGLARWLAGRGMLDKTILGGKHLKGTMEYFSENKLPVDHRGEAHDYDLVLIGTDTIVPRNILGKKVILVQEGMMVPEDWRYRLVRRFGLPRYFANTSTTGLSHCYVRFCVASEGFRELFAAKGIDPEKIAVTGIPNFDHAAQYLDNDFPHHNYVLAATSALRESWNYENRLAYLKKVVRIAEGRPIIFKLHPNERLERATREIERIAPGNLIYSSGNTNHMIANCDALVTKFSTVLMVALALDKPVYSDLSQEELVKLKPIQNGGTSALRIADICREYL